MDLSDHSSFLGDERIVHAFLKVRDPFVAWQVYRGALASSAAAHEDAVSFWLAELLRSLKEGDRRQGHFRREIAIERIRERRYPNVVSRLRGFYAFPDHLSAVCAAEQWTGDLFHPRYMAELHVVQGARVSRHDSNWISQELDPDDGSWIESYLAGEQAGGWAPIWELLMDARMVVYGTDLREQAGETVRRTWPDSVALLEIARLGGELGSDLGLITPMMLGDRRDGLEVNYCVNMQDAKDEEFLRRLGRYIEGGAAVNRKDLAVGGDSFTVPDLTGRSFRL